MAYKKLSHLDDIELDRIVHEIVEGRLVKLDPDSSAVFEIVPKTLPQYSRNRSDTEAAVRALIHQGKLNTRTTWPIVTARCLYKGKIEPVAFLLQNNAPLKAVPGARNWTVIRGGNLERAMCELIVLHFWRSRAGLDLGASSTMPVSGLLGSGLLEMKLEDDGISWAIETVKPKGKG
jgi:hypothetical protein